MYVDWDAIEADYLINEAEKAYERGNATAALVLLHKANVKRQESITKSYQILQENFQKYKEEVSKHEKKN